MARRCVLIVAACAAALLVAPSGAWAGPFGGFDPAGKAYLVSPDRICRPLPVAGGKAAGPSACRRAGAAEVARGRFRRDGQAGRGRGLRAEAQGRHLAIFTERADRAGSPVVRWDAGVVVSRVLAVYSARAGRLVAVEYEARDLGRVAVLVVAFDRGGEGKSVSATPRAPEPASDPAPAPTAGRPAEQQGRKLAQPRARSRAATPSATAFERLVAHGGVWEQALVPCEQARVRLRLERRGRTFALDVELRCQTIRDRLSFDGTWTSEGEARLLLRFPNDEIGAEEVLCGIGRCRDSAADRASGQGPRKQAAVEARGEDCVRCDVDRDLSFTLRPVRRPARRR